METNPDSVGTTEEPECECDGCDAKSHALGGPCHADYATTGKHWSRRTWANHIDKLLCPDCWQDLATTKTPDPGLVS